MISEIEPVRHDGPIAYFDDDGVAVFRASAVGFCEAALYHSLRGEEAQKPSADMLRRFEEGHFHEPAIIKHLEAESWVIDQEMSQRELRLAVSDKIVIVGHVDGVAQKDGVSAVVEVKALAESGYKTWVAKHFEGFPKYAMQITVYMTALGMPTVYAVKDKNSGKIAVDVFHETPYRMPKIKAKLTRVLKAVNEGQTPDCPGNFDYPCPFLHLHPERAKTPKGDKPNDVRAEMENVASLYQEANSQEAYWKALKGEYRAEILASMGTEGIVYTGLHHITATTKRVTRLDMGRLRAGMPDLSQFEVTSDVTTLKVEVAV